MSSLADRRLLSAIDSIFATTQKHKTQKPGFSFPQGHLISLQGGLGLRSCGKFQAMLRQCSIHALANAQHQSVF
jgi:hypothetical protein